MKHKQTYLQKELYTPQIRCQVTKQIKSTPDFFIPKQPAPPLLQECQVSETLEECAGAGQVWYFDPNRNECVAHENQEAGAGAQCRQTGVFQSEETCQRACGAFRDLGKRRRCTQNNILRSYSHNLVYNFIEHSDISSSHPFYYSLQ